MTLTLSDAARTAQLEAIRTLVDAGGRGALLSIYEGPAKLLCLARLPLSMPCGTIAGNALTIAPIGDASAAGTGKAGWGTIAANGGEVVLEFDVGEAGAALVLNTTVFTIGGPVKIDSFVLTAAE